MGDNHRQLAKHDVRPFCLLVVLYFLQGIPVGLAFGTVPFLLKSMAKDTTFTELGLFSMATYPYSLKILWSPIVDSFYSSKIGRRRSWIIPVQLISGLMLWLLGFLISHNWVFAGVDNAYKNSDVPIDVTGKHLNISSLTLCFLLLVFLCATQDIAVDGWALEILSKQSLSYASTAQTIGLNTGYFLSFTIFLTFNSGDFINKYIRSSPKEYGIISFSNYLQLAGILYVAVTLYVMFFTKERPSTGMILPTNTKKSDEKDLLQVEYNSDIVGSTDNTRLTDVYTAFWKILKLPSVQSLMTIHFVSKFAFQCNEGATNLKLLERGFKREDLAITVLIDFPFEIIFGYYVAKWSTYIRHEVSSTETSNKLVKFLVGETGVLTPWLWGFLGRLTAAIMGNYLVSQFPSDGKITRGYFFLVIFQHLLGSFMSTVQFVGISAFHTRIADPVIGGTYMTLLNTLSNLGGTWPRLLIMYMIDTLTNVECDINGLTEELPMGKAECISKGGKVIVLRDGYYITNIICIIIGIILYFGFIKKSALRLQKMPITSWRCL
ncbi:LAFE_0C06986g1_1 [Lachancea fermentati]|uniref:LAFE_0C06986g1_1 n=1 Tax=Lachancea fermentati TaxID=4955 RepID=A0A1G4M9Y1_LACFM|nr:LAFE_0C06986g1_1 [Lachancea fermentati]